MGESWSLPSVHRTMTSGEEPNSVTSGRFMKNMYGEALRRRIRRYRVKASPVNGVLNRHDGTT